MAAKVSFGNGHVLKSLSFVNQALPASGDFNTPFVDVSQFSSFNIVAANSSSDLSVIIRYSLNAIVSDETCLEQLVLFPSSTDLTDLGSYLIKARFLSIRLEGASGHNFCLQLVFREGPTFNGLLEDVGPFAQIYVEGTPGSFRTLQSSDGSLTITQNTDNIDIVGSASFSSKWNEVGNILYPKNNNVSIIAGGGSTNSVANGINNGILAGNGNIIPSQGQYCIIAGGNGNTFSGSGTKVDCAIIGGNLNSMIGGITAFYNTIIGGQSNTLDTSSSSGNDYIRWSNIMSSSGCSMTTLTGTTDYCNIIGSLGSLINNSTKSSIIGANASNITGGGNAFKSNCVIMGGDTNNITGTNDKVSNSGVINSTSSSITAAGGCNIASGLILASDSSTMTSTNSNFLRSGIILSQTSNITTNTGRTSIISSIDSSVTGSGLKSQCVIIGGTTCTISGTGTKTSCFVTGNANTISVDANILYSGIYSGSTNTISPTSSSSYNVIVGGVSNQIIDSGVKTSCSILAGSQNIIQGTGLKSNCGIYGGISNNITGTSTVGGCVIMGGNSNTITSSTGTASNCVILGGSTNSILGAIINSVAGGANAIAANNGSFVWNNGDSISSTATNQWTVNAIGGSRFFSNAAASTGVTLAAGGNSWASVCDINVKENLVELDEEDVLEKLGELVVYKYNYIGNPVEQICYGTTAQNFHEIFPYPKITVVNETTGFPEEVSSKDPCSIESMDLIGLMLSGLKQLRAENIQMRADFEEYKTNNDQRVLELETEVDNLTMTINSHSSSISSLNISSATNTSNIIKLNNVKLGLSIF